MSERPYYPGFPAQLRKIADGLNSTKHGHTTTGVKVMYAADEIECLRTEVIELRHLLKTAEPIISAQRQTKHRLDEFQRQKMPIDAFLARVNAAVAAKKGKA